MRKQVCKEAQAHFLLDGPHLGGILQHIEKGQGKVTLELQLLLRITILNASISIDVLGCLLGEDEGPFTFYCLNRSLYGIEK